MVFDNETAHRALLLQARPARRSAAAADAGARPSASSWRDGKTRVHHRGQLLPARCPTASSRASPTRCPTTRCSSPAPAARGDSKRLASASAAPSSSSKAGSTSRAARYELQLNWPDVSTAPTRPVPRGRQHRLGPHQGRTASSVIKFGQFKAPYGRQQLTSSGAQQFVDRAIRTRASTTRARPASRSGARSGQQAGLARDGVERQRPHPDPQRQRQVPLHRARHVAGAGQRAHEPVGTPGRC